MSSGKEVVIPLSRRFICLSMTTVAIEHLTGFPADGLAELLAASEREGFRFVRRLVAGDDRFDRHGEALFAASVGGRVVGVCGLTIDSTSSRSSAGRESGDVSSGQWWQRHAATSGDCGCAPTRTGLTSSTWHSAFSGPRSQIAPTSWNWHWVVGRTRPTNGLYLPPASAPSRPCLLAPSAA